jgi:hypothetical protein
MRILLPYEKRISVNIGNQDFVGRLLMSELREKRVGCIFTACFI